MLIGSAPPPRITISAFSELTVPFSVMISADVEPTVRSFANTVSLLIVVVPVDAPMLRVVVAPAKLTVVAPAFSKLNEVDVVLSDVRMFGLVWNTRRSRPVLSLIKPRSCVDVVEENEARVSDLYATLPPFLKLTVTVPELLSVVNRQDLCTSRLFAERILIDADAVLTTPSPLILVAVAAPREGPVSVGDTRVLFVRT